MACAVFAIVLVPAPAAATERVTDGSFEKSFCDSSDTTGCTNSSWTFGGLVDPSTTLIGPFCGEQATGTECGAPADAPYSGSDWARLGAGEGPGSTTNQYVDDWVKQDVMIPPSTVPGKSPTLSFFLRIIDRPESSGELNVTVGGHNVFFVDDEFVGYSTWELVSIDLSSVAAPNPQTLEFDGYNIFPADALGATAHSDSYDIDDVSIQTPDPSSSSGGNNGGGNPNPAPTPVPAPTPTPPPANRVTIRGGLVAGDTATIPVTCAGDATCSGLLQLLKQMGTAKRPNKAIVFGTSRFSVPAHQTVRVKVKLNAAGKKLLKQHRPVKLTVRATIAGQVTTTSATLRHSNNVNSASIESPALHGHRVWLIGEAIGGGQIAVNTRTYLRRMTSRPVDRSPG